MAYHNLLSKVDQALVAYLISAGAGTADDVFTHKRAGDLPNPPFTTCFADSGREEVPKSGVYKVKASVDVHTNCAPDKDEDTDQMKLDSDARVAATFDALHDLYEQCGDQLADLITAAARAAGVENFTVQDVAVAEISQGRADKDGEWIDSLDLELTCNPKDNA
jgi:hypothetical protein